MRQSTLLCPQVLRRGAVGDLCHGLHALPSPQQHGSHELHLHRRSSRLSGRLPSCRVSDPRSCGQGCMVGGGGNDRCLYSVVETKGEQMVVDR